MKIKFKTQAYQSAAVQAVVDCFAGQAPSHGGVRYRLDPGTGQPTPSSPQGALALEDAPTADEQEAAFRYGDITLPADQLLGNIQKVQRHQNLPVSPRLVSTKVCGAPCRAISCRAWARVSLGGWLGGTSRAKLRPLTAMATASMAAINFAIILVFIGLFLKASKNQEQN